MAMKENSLLTASGGFSRSPSNLEKSKSLGIIDRIFETMDEGIQWADWIILSIPVDAICAMLPEILNQLRPGQAVVDFGSTKNKICQSVQDHPNRAQFIAAHPIAGTEYSGPEAAFSTLFRQKLMILCEREKTNPELLEAFEKVCRTLQMQLEYMNAVEHDTHLAYISHLSHVTSFALSNAVLEKEKDGNIVLELAGSGFASTVRLAKSSPDMWAPIFFENKQMVLEAVSRFSATIEAFKDMLETDDWEGMRKFLEEGRKIKRVIK